jgi:predicted RNase H-like nuclease (RuvC/YqgF family)
VDAAETQNAAEQRKPWAGAQVSAQQTEDCAQNERAIEDLETQVAQLESKYSALNGTATEFLVLDCASNMTLDTDKYKALDRDHNELLADSKSTALDIKAKDSKIEELMQMLEISRSKQQDKPATSDEEGPAMEGRLKLLEVRCW